MLKTNALYKGYSKKDVLKDVTVTFEPGTIYGLIGPNGSGKTTLLRCLSGIYRPDRGTVTMEEGDVYDNPEAKKNIAYTEDNPGFNQLYTVSRQGEYYGIFYENFSKEVFEEYLAEFELDGRANANSLSLGQKKKLALSLALSKTPRVLLLDEPENGLDNEARRTLRSSLREAADNGSTVVLSSHDLSNIEDMCDEIIFLNEGKVILQATIDEMFENISKWTVKAQNDQLPGAVVLEAGGELLTVVCKGNRAESRAKLEQAGAEIISADKITLTDAYFIYKEAAHEEE